MHPYPSGPFMHYWRPSPNLCNVDNLGIAAAPIANTPPFWLFNYIGNGWPRLAPTLQNIMCILGLALLVGNDAAKHASHCASSTATTRISPCSFFGSRHDGCRVGSCCAGWRTLTPHNENSCIALECEHGKAPTRPLHSNTNCCLWSGHTRNKVTHWRCHP